MKILTEGCQKSHVGLGSCAEQDGACITLKNEGINLQNHIVNGQIDLDSLARALRASSNDEMLMSIARGSITNGCKIEETITYAAIRALSIQI